MGKPQQVSKNAIDEIPIKAVEALETILKMAKDGASCQAIQALAENTLKAFDALLPKENQAIPSGPTVTITRNNIESSTETLDAVSLKNAAQIVMLALIDIADTLGVGYDNLPELASIQASLAGDGFIFTVKSTDRTISARYTP